MSLLSKLRCITIDVTGTLLAYKGELGDYYCMAAKSVGLPCPDYKRVHEGFKFAYKEMAKNYPCFGYAAKMPNIIWWKTCVRDSFIRVRNWYGCLDIHAWHVDSQIYSSTDGFSIGSGDPKPLNFMLSVLHTRKHRYWHATWWNAIFWKKKNIGHETSIFSKKKNKYMLCI